MLTACWIAGNTAQTRGWPGSARTATIQLSTERLLEHLRAQGMVVDGYIKFRCARKLQIYSLPGGLLASGAVATALHALQPAMVSASAKRCLNARFSSTTANSM
jgi:hypothetical protein